MMESQRNIYKQQSHMLAKDAFWVKLLKHAQARGDRHRTNV